jgi:protein gp37
MGQASEIEWTDATWNPTVGCKMVSPGCARCYAQTMSHRLAGMARADIKTGKNPGRKRNYLDVMRADGKFDGTVRFVPEALGDPLTWRTPRRVFVNSMSDLFHEGMPFPYIDQVWDVMRRCPQHTFQVLTKRPERMAAYFADVDRTARAEHGDGIRYIPLPNVWLGTSVEDQQRADERIPHLLRCPAAVRFLSCEPLLGPVNLKPWLWQRVVETYHGDPDGVEIRRRELHWAISGGESGPGARPCNVEWVRSIVGQCKAAGVACFVKQLGANVEATGGDVPGMTAAGESIRVRLADKKGGEPEEWPEDLRVRDMPAAISAGG